MRRQRNLAQMKEQIKTLERKLNKREISNPSDAEFKTPVIRMFKELSEDLSSIKKIQSETEATLIEIKNNLWGNSRLNEANNQINDMEHKEAKTNQSEQEEEKRIQKNEVSVSSVVDNFKHSNICIIGVPEGEEKDQEIGNLSEKKIVKENFHNLMKEIDMQV